MAGKSTKEIIMARLGKGPIRETQKPTRRADLDPHKLDPDLRETQVEVAPEFLLDKMKKRDDKTPVERPTVPDPRTTIELSSDDIMDGEGRRSWEDMNVNEKLEALYAQMNDIIEILQELPEDIKMETTKATLELLRAALGNEDQGGMEKRITRQFSTTENKTNVVPSSIHELFKQVNAIKSLLNKSVSIDLMVRVEKLEARMGQLEKGAAPKESAPEKPKSSSEKPKSFFRRRRDK